MSESRGYPRSKASKGEAVVSYCEPVATREMGCHRLSRRGKQKGISSIFYISFIEAL
ncbi:MAG: hypothetical protein V3S72_02590 [Desulfobacterales bacterium]